PGRRRSQEYAARAVAAGHVVVQRSAFAQWHPDETALGSVGGLADRLRDLARLAVAEADPAFLVADDHQRRKAEAAAAFHHLAPAFVVDRLVGEFTVALFPLAAITRFTCHVFVPTRFSSAVVRL